MERLIQNAIYLPQANKYIVSRHTHDWVPFRYDGSEVVDGKWEGYIDGGQEYQRCGGNWINDPNGKVEDWCIYEDSPEELYRQRILWGSYGKSGTAPLTWLPVISLTTDHIQNILRDMGDIIHPMLLKFMEDILIERGEVPNKPLHWTIRAEAKASIEISEEKGKNKKLLE